MMQKVLGVIKPQVIAAPVPWPFFRSPEWVTFKSEGGDQEAEAADSPPFFVLLCIAWIP